MSPMIGDPDHDPENDASREGNSAPPSGQGESEHDSKIPTKTRKSSDLPFQKRNSSLKGEDSVRRGSSKRSSASRDKDSSRGSQRSSEGSGARHRHSSDASRTGYQGRNKKSSKANRTSKGGNELEPTARAENASLNVQEPSRHEILESTPASVITLTTSTEFGNNDNGEDEDVGTDPFKIPDDTSFEKLVEVYEGVTQGLSSIEKTGINLSTLTDEFSRLWEGIGHSHQNEINLIQTDREVSIKLSAAMGRCKNLIKLAEDDPIFASKLGVKLEKAWQVADAGEVDENEIIQKIENLRADVFELTRNINAAMRIEGQETVRDLQGLKKDLDKQRDAANAEANKYRAILNILFAKRQELFDKRTALEERKQLLEEEWAAQLEATERETARKEHLAEETAEVKEKMEEKSAQLREVHRSLLLLGVKVLDTEKATKEQRMVNENASREAEFSFQRIEKMRADVENQQNLVERLTIDAYRQQQELKAREIEMQQLRRELQRIMRQRSMNLKKNILLRQAMAALDIEREKLKGKVAALEKDLEKAQKELEENKKTVEVLDKQRSLLNRNLKRAVMLTSEHSTVALSHETAVKNIEHSVNTYRGEISFQRDQIDILEQERDFYSLEATKFAQIVVFRLLEIKKLDMALFEYKKKLANMEMDLKKLQQIYNLAQSDKAMFERTLRDAISEIKENYLKIKRMRNQIAGLRNQVNQKDEIIHQEALRYDRILKETEFFTKHVGRIRQLADDLLRQVEALGLERSSICCSLAELKGELSKHLFYADSAESRRRVYQRRIMESEKEVRNVWEKWRVLHSTIRIGAYHYRNMVKEIQQLRHEILERRKIQQNVAQNTKNYQRCRREVTLLENYIAKEKCMINAIEVQMQHPINVHRWRLLEVMNPEAYEMVVRINLLTKRLVTRNYDLRRQDRDLSEKQKMYVEIRKSLERSPSLELPEEMVYYENLLVAKKQQYQCLRHELRTAESQIGHYRQQVQGLHHRMIHLKEMYFANLKAAAGGRQQIPICTCIPLKEHKLHGVCHVRPIYHDPVNSVITETETQE